MKTGMLSASPELDTVFVFCFDLFVWRVGVGCVCVCVCKEGHDAHYIPSCNELSQGKPILGTHQLR